MFWYVTKSYRSSNITSHVLSLFLDTLMLWTNIAIAHDHLMYFLSMVPGSCSHLCPVGPYVQYGVCTVTYVYQKMNQNANIYIYIYMKNTLIFMEFSWISTNNIPCVFVHTHRIFTGCSLAECLGPLCVEDFVKGGSKCCGIHSSLVQRVFISQKFTMTGCCFDPFCHLFAIFFWGPGGTHIGDIETWCKALLDFEGFSWKKKCAFVWVGNTKTAVGAASLRGCWCIRCNCVIQPMKSSHIERNNYLPTAIFRG